MGTVGNDGEGGGDLGRERSPARPSLAQRDRDVASLAEGREHGATSVQA